MNDVGIGGHRRSSIHESGEIAGLQPRDGGSREVKS